MALVFNDKNLNVLPNDLGKLLLLKITDNSSQMHTSRKGIVLQQ